jgi:hypothetical protein
MMRLLVLFLLPFSCFAQQLDHHDLLMFPLNPAAGGGWAPGRPQFLTSFNPYGYNNQPSFFSLTEIYLTVQTPGDTTQTDIQALDLATRIRTPVTATPTAEYSPTRMPDGQSFSAVRVEEDGSQRLWTFPLSRLDNGQPVFPDILSVGYHCWLNDTLVALFLVGENGAAHTLAVAGTRAQKIQRIASNIGRTLLTMPDGRLAFVQKATEQTWFVKAYDPRRQASDILFKTLPGVEDFAVLPDGSFLSGRGPKLFHLRPDRNPEWKEIADLSAYGVTSISRLAVSQDYRLVVVVQ